MNRVDRLFGILTLLQAKKFVTVEKIAEKYELSDRTVYRDLKALGELGIPISFEPNKGYFIVQGYFLPPLTFTAEEANALILMASLSEKFADNSILKNSKNALNKIKNVLKTYDNDKTEIFENHINVYLPTDQKPNNDFLATIQKSITEKTILEIDYTNNHNIASQRLIEPIGLVFYTFQWHVIGWCYTRKEYRDFKVKMISKLKETNQPFKKQNHWDINQYIKSLK
jgi:predicted DNA-binding transcriptional regulator YafY